MIYSYGYMSVMYIIYYPTSILYLEDYAILDASDIAIFMAFPEFTTKNHEVLPLARRPIAGGAAATFCLSRIDFGAWNHKEVSSVPPPVSRRCQNGGYSV